MTQSEIDKYKWYHHFVFRDGVHTTPRLTDIEHFIWMNMSKTDLDFRNKTVIDIGCRDGKFSFLAETLGVSRVVGVDNDLSKGMTELLIPAFHSKVETLEANLIHLTPEQVKAPFDIVMLFGVLYHLRYPVYGLKRAVDLLKHGGLMLIETAVFVSEPQDIPIMFCPYVFGNPYERGSVSYFNKIGLETVLYSLGCTIVRVEQLVGSDTNKTGINNVRREFFIFKKTHETPQYLREYWDGVHCCQSAMVENSVRGE